MALYALLLLLTFFFPFILSFDKKVHFYKGWKTILPSIVIVGFVFVLTDIFLTDNGVWGFNSNYHSNLFLFNLPIEEWLFFIVVPYACIFIHEVIVAYFPKLKFSDKTSSAISLFLFITIGLIGILHYNKIYTIYVVVLTLIALIWALFSKSKILNSFYVTFLIMLIPFLIVNSILTGSFIEQEVVWYNDLENLGVRIFMIPVEDAAYAFSLILLNLLVNHTLKSLIKKRNINYAIQ